MLVWGPDSNGRPPAQYPIVQEVLASMPAIRVAPEDVEAATADLVRRILAAHRHPRQRPLIGYRAIIETLLNLHEAWHRRGTNSCTSIHRTNTKSRQQAAPIDACLVVKGGFGRVGVTSVLAGVVLVGVGLGVAARKSRLAGCKAGHARDRVVPGCPPGPILSGRR
jgi:hypothetical protein